MICLLGQNHKTASVGLREKIAVTDEKRNVLVEILRSDPVLTESVVLSTCNRMELYTVASDGDAEQRRQRLGAILSEVHGVDEREWASTSYFSRDEHAIRHLFRVASGLDSMVLGEGQILAQVKDAQEFARGQKIAHEVLERVFNEAISCGKRVRSDTSISEGSVSVAAASVSLARKIFDDIANQSVLLVGAGDTGTRVARHLQLFGVKDLRVTNRTRARADALATELNASVVPFDQLDEHLGQVSIAITAVASQEPLFTADRVKAAIHRTRSAPLFMIDLAVPRNVAPDVDGLGGVFVYDVDDLQGIVLGDEAQRREEAAKAEEIVTHRVGGFVQWYRMRAAVPALNELRQHLETLRQAEIDAVRNKVHDKHDLELVDKVTARLINKLLHPPTVELKRRVAEDGPAAHLDAFRQLFGLDGRADGDRE
ncbi:glutamyl-tRNA reductase [bacterium]|nr:MAG: glutamyl-tRNA reductase [bacterium]